MDAFLKLARELAHLLTIRGPSGVPEAESLRELIEVCYVVSLQTEEGKPLLPAISVADPAACGESTERMLVPARARSFLIEPVVPVTSNVIRKIGTAIDAESGTLLTWPVDGVWQIWGVADQGLHHRNSLGSCGALPRPGLLYIQIRPRGHLRAYSRHNFLAALVINEVLPAPFQYGFNERTVWAKLSPFLQERFRRLQLEQHDCQQYAAWWTDNIRSIVREALTFEHGGAILFTRSARHERLSAKVRLNYERLGEYTDQCFLQAREEHRAYEEICERAHEKAETLSFELYRREHDGRLRHRQNRRGLDGAVRFVAGATRLDGAVVFDENLNMIGFGVELLARDGASTVEVHKLRDGYPVSETVRIDSYGTRHRSMIRHCAVDESALGIIISQDGTVRLTTAGGNGVELWDDVSVDETSTVVRDLRSDPNVISLVEYNLDGKRVIR